jgi:hypothetical protein
MAAQNVVHVNQQPGGEWTGAHGFEAQFALFRRSLVHLIIPSSLERGIFASKGPRQSQVHEVPIAKSLALKAYPTLDMRLWIVPFVSRASYRSIPISIARTALTKAMSQSLLASS